jgi:lipopolysaccharide export system permease protein
MKCFAFVAIVVKPKGVKSGYIVAFEGKALLKNYWSSGSFYVLGAAFRPMRNAFIYIVVILECVRLKLVWSIAIHQPHPASTVVQYLLQWLPLYVGLALQISLAVGLMFGLAKLSRSREIDSLHALGFGWMQLLSPILGLTLFVVFLEFVILGWLQPLSIYYSKALAHQIEQSSTLISDGTDMFAVNDQKTVLIDQISRDGNLFSRVFIYENFSDKKSVTTAGSNGQLIGLGGLANQTYSVNSVDIMEVKYDANHNPLSSTTVTRTNNVQGPLRQFAQASFRERGASEFEWTLSELVAGKNLAETSIESIRKNAEINYRLAQVLFIMLVPFIAVIIIIEPRRNPGPMRFFCGILIVLGFNQYLSMATSFSRDNILPPNLTLWLPLTALTLLVIVLFRNKTMRPARGSAR